MFKNDYLPNEWGNKEYIRESNFQSRDNMPKIGEAKRVYSPNNSTRGANRGLRSVFDRANIGNNREIQSGRSIQNVQNGEYYTLQEAKEVLEYDELIEQNFAMSEHILFLMNHIENEKSRKNYENIDEVLYTIAQDLDISVEKLLSYIEQKIKKYPELESEINNPEFLMMIADELSNQKSPFVKPDFILSSTESKVVADDIRRRAKRGDNISDEELGRAILNFRS